MNPLLAIHEPCFGGKDIRDANRALSGILPGNSKYHTMQSLLWAACVKSMSTSMMLCLPDCAYCFYPFLLIRNHEVAVPVVVPIAVPVVVLGTIHTESIHRVGKNVIRRLSQWYNVP